MLNDRETEHLIDLLCATAEVLGHEVRPAAAMLMADDLSKYPLDALRKALARCRAELTGRLTPKAILDRLQDGGAWLTANEAWAVALPAYDEAATVVWTDEIAKAWAIALPIMRLGDKVGARMAFIPAYERLIQVAREAGKPAHWFPCIGWDAGMREHAVEKARTAGLLPPPKPVPALPNPEGTKDRRVELVAALRNLSETMKTNAEQEDEERAQRREEERQRFEARKAEVVAQALALDEQHKMAQPKAAEGDA